MPRLPAHLETTGKEMKWFALGSYFIAILIVMDVPERNPVFMAAASGALFVCAGASSLAAWRIFREVPRYIIILMPQLYITVIALRLAATWVPLALAVLAPP